MAGRRLGGHGLVDVRVEVGARGLDRRDVALAQQLGELLVDQLDAGAVGGDRLRRALAGRESAIK